MEEVAKELNNFFANAVKNLNNPNYEYCDSLEENIDDPILEAIAKWRNHPSTLAIGGEYTNRGNFYMNFVSKEDGHKSAGYLEGHSGEWHSG